LLEEAKADLPKTPSFLEIAARLCCITSPIHNPTRRATTGAEDLGTEGFPGENRHGLRQRVRVAGGPRRGSRRRKSREYSEAPRPVW